MHLGDLLHYIGPRDKTWLLYLRAIAEDKARALDVDEHAPKSAA